MLEVIFTCALAANILHCQYMNINAKHKDSVFSALFSNPEALRELYSAIEGVTLPPEIPININTLSDVLYMEQLNDISFTIDNRLVVLVEHQSSINPNMPLRLLLYIARVYEKIINRKKLYSTKLEKIPVPEFIVLYNGKEPYPDRAVLKFSDAFREVADLRNAVSQHSSLELEVQVYNINHGHNVELLKKSGTLGDYSMFIGKIREYEKTLSHEEAMKNAIKYCMDNNILNPFLEDHGTEVFNMLLTEWNTEEAKEVWFEEGLEAGMEKGKESVARNALAKGISPDMIREITGLDLESIQSLR